MAVLSSSLKPPRTSRAGKRRKQVSPATPVTDHRVVLACRLDRSADALLFLGCHLAAERLAIRAQALREVAQ